MPNPILVTYATQYGSTREVAERVAAALSAGGLQADLQPVKKVRSLEPYRAVVLGAPLYMFRWHADALRFLGRQRQALAARPVAIFALGPFHEIEKERLSAREQLDKELAKYPWLKPAAVEVFTGKFDPAKLTFPFNRIGPLKAMPPSDERNWPAIEAWAHSLLARLP